jgi:hypothetical protein
MMSLKEFQKLEVGDLLEFGPLFPGLSKEPVFGKVLKLKKPKEDIDAVELSLEYHDTFIGAYTVKRKGDRLIILSGGL